ncbi:MAG: PEP-CTERM sorting domain-containing protein [Armatimonadetes bacterium]|nr:PEP-CTERM sorting domain-containing protein [Armatimonadota bacterium]
MKSIFHSFTLTACLLATVGATAHAQNLITNADFSGGNTGFTSDYEFVLTNISTTPTAEYGVVLLSNTWNINFPAFGDNTPGISNMLIANGSAVAGQAFWSQTVAVTQNTTYVFSGFATSAFTQSAPVIEYFAGTTSLGIITPSTATPGTFEFFTGTWNSGTNTSVELRLVDNNLAENGNDLAVDDLSFVAVPEGSTAALLALVGVPMLGFLRRRATK